MGRIAALLLLLVLPLGAACAEGSSGGGEGSSGVRGTVLLGPQCPVVQEDSPCPDEPIDGAGIEVLQEGVVVKTATSGADGRFQVAVAPGTYELRAVPPEGVGMSVKPVSVTVTAGEFVEVDLLVDTGIR